MSLREDLANSLYDSYCDGPRFREEYGSEDIWRFDLSRITGDSGGSAEMNREPWLRVADECIRQMEWARMECRRLPLRGLTLAPPEWKPE